jgi:hypothetical protein
MRLGRREAMRKLLMAGVVCLAVLAVRSQAAEPLRYLLTDTASGTWLKDFALEAAALGGQAGEGWRVRKETLRGGMQDGVDLITLDNGRLTIRVVPTRGMSVVDVRQGDFRLGWESPVKELVHPSLINLESRGGLGWLQGFNEWMVRCGLEFAGHPGTDEVVDNTGATSSVPLTLHGRIGNLPASRVELLIDREPPYRLRLRGVVHERWFMGAKLELVTELSTEPGSDRLRIEDAVTNRGGTPQEFQLIYHANYGAPLLEDNAKVVTAARRIAPMNEHAAKAIKRYETYAGPTAGFVEEVFLVWPYADESGKARVLLHDAAGERAASIQWSIDELPYLTIWKNTAAREDGYVTGLEPATGFPFNRGVERVAGRVPTLAAGETRRFTLEFGLHEGRDAVASEVAAAAAVQNGRPTQIDDMPPGE